MKWDVWSIPLDGEPVQLGADVEHVDPIELLKSYTPHERTAALSVQVAGERLAAPVVVDGKGVSWRETNAAGKRAHHRRRNKAAPTS